jgi:hypothetical protein
VEHEDAAGWVFHVKRPGASNAGTYMVKEVIPHSKGSFPTFEQDILS